MQPTSLTPGETLWDCRRALARLGEDDVLLQEMMYLFTLDAQKKFVGLKESVANGDRETTARLAHCLKSLAATFDALPLVRLCRALEDCTKSSEPPVERVESLLDQVGEQIELLDEEFESHLEARVA